MAANEASRLSSESEHSKERPERLATSIATPIATVREVPSESGVAPADPSVEAREETSDARAMFGSPAEPRASTAGAQNSDAREQDSDAHEDNLDALERAADGIRPSWHGAEVPARVHHVGLPPVPSTIPAPFPPPAPLPAFASFPIDRAPQYNADSTVRTAALLPESLAHILNAAPIARASSWLRARPWALWTLAASAALLLLLLLWPSSEPAASAARQDVAPAGAAARAPAPPALPTPPVPSAASPATEASAATPSKPEPAADNGSPLPVPNAKRRDKRAARVTPKAVVAKPRKAVSSEARGIGARAK